MEKSVIYEDEKGIKITRADIHVDGMKFPLGDLRDIRLKRINVSRWPGFIFFGIGIVGLLIGSLKFTGSPVGEWNLVMEPVGGETLYIGLGVLAILTGIILMVVLKDRFIVSIKIDNQEKVLSITADRASAIHLAGVLKKVFYQFVPGKKLPLHINRATVTGS